MNSLSKTPLPLPAAQQVVARHLGSSLKISTLEELKEGFFNAAYRIELDDGLCFVLKIAPPPGVRVLRYEQDIMTAEVETLRLVRAHTGMPVPNILFADLSCSLLPSAYFAMEFIQGQPLNKLRESLDKELLRNIDIATGQYLRQMNAITGESFGCFAHPQPQGAPWSSAFFHLLEDVLLDGQEAGVQLPGSAGDILALAARFTPILDEVTRPSLVHWDLWDGNIFIDPGTGLIRGIIDFERAIWADPLMECNFGAFGLNPDFLAGYGQPQPFTPAEQARRAIYNVYLFLIMVIECTYRQYPTNDQENWARMRLGQELEKLAQPYPSLS